MKSLCLVETGLLPEFVMYTPTNYLDGPVKVHFGIFDIDQ